jgi:hypothetical protein
MNYLMMNQMMKLMMRKKKMTKRNVIENRMKMLNLMMN